MQSLNVRTLIYIKQFILLYGYMRLIYSIRTPNFKILFQFKQNDYIISSYTIIIFSLISDKFIVFYNKYPTYLYYSLYPLLPAVALGINIATNKSYSLRIGQAQHDSLLCIIILLKNRRLKN